MKKLENIASAIGKTAGSITTLMKVAIMSGKPFRHASSDKKNSLLILANGPSLRSVLDLDRKELMKYDRLAVNFFANSPEYSSIRPDIYVMADSHFFSGQETDENVKNLWKNLTATTWNMILMVPVRVRIPVKLPSCITIQRFNMTPAEGFKALQHLLFRTGVAMPRPRNVLIPSIMTAIRAGYRRILLAGADHSWSRTLWVNDNNNVISVQPHFYKDNDKEKQRVESEYAGYHLHDIFKSLHIAFSSYFKIAEFAKKSGVEIINITPGSFIDAFPRREFPLNDAK